MERRDNPLITGITTATMARPSVAAPLVVIGAVLPTAACVLFARLGTRP